VDKTNSVGQTLAQFRQSHREKAHIEHVVRNGQILTLSPDTALQKGDFVRVIGIRSVLVTAGQAIGQEIADGDGFEMISENRDVVITRKNIVGLSLEQAYNQLDPNIRRGVFATRLTRAGQEIPLRLSTVLLAGDIVTLFGPASAVAATAEMVGYSIDESKGADYAYLGLGIIVGILLGMISVSVAGSDIALHTGGGCLISGLLFGWFRSKRPTFGKIPTATAMHLRDYGLSIFIASVGLASGPQALALVQEKGLMLPLMSLAVVVIPLTACTLYARFILKMPPVLVCGALAGILTCTPALNALVSKAKSESPVAGYTVPYAVSNVILTLLGPIIVLTT
jgi:AspT/YidE/YbjL antiporter-like protein